MHILMKKTLLISLLSVVLPAQAAIQEYSFSGAADSGYYNGTTYTGTFSFDDAGLTMAGLELLSLSSLSFNFSGATYDLSTPALAIATAVFQDGVFSGIEWSVDSTSPVIGFTFVPGTVDTTDAFFAYDTSLGFSGAGSLAYSNLIPEPETGVMLIAGLALSAAVVRRKRVALTSASL